MAIPNTTPTPNELYNEMPKMTDTELRVVLVITRKTLGWEINHTTGMRKPEDWISRSQLEKLTNRGHTIISIAIDSCINKQWIEARDIDGNILDTPDKRKKIGQGGKIYYRLGLVFLNPNPEIAYQKVDSKDGNQKIAGQKVEGFAYQKVATTKETKYTKEDLSCELSEKQGKDKEVLLINKSEGNEAKADCSLTPPYSAAPPSLKPEVKEFLEYFCLKTNRKLHPTEERIKIIKKRFKEGRTLDELKTAVDNFIQDDWPDRYKYTDIVYCIGTRNKIDMLDKWLNYSNGNDFKPKKVREMH